MTKTASLSACDGNGLRAQFGCPRGRLGWIIGHLMAFKNRQRSRFVLSLLDVRPNDRVVEVGFGSGSDLARVKALTAGRLAGIDHSEVMLRMARRRNRDEVDSGRMDLRLGEAESLPFAADSFEKLFSINAAQFFPDRLAAFREFRRVLAPKGMAVVAIQPRSKGATEKTADDTADALLAAMRAVGFADTYIRRKAMRPVSTVCAIGWKIA